MTFRISWKLTTSQRCQVAEFYRQGLPIRHISQQFGISINAVSAIANGKGLRRRKTRSDRKHTAQPESETFAEAAVADDYNAEDDFAKSLDDGYKAIRERIAKGGKPWTPK